jgi:tricorn protease
MMRLIVSAVLVSSVVVTAHAREPIHLANNPDLSPDGSVVTFDWNGDIWTVPSRGGAAHQLTTHPARDSQPKFSPDGKQIAFISDRDGSSQVYVMAASGGTPRQITFNTAGFALNGWSPDGKKVLVSSQRDNYWRHAERFFLINVDSRSGEEMLFDDYGANGQLSPDGTKLLFTREGAPWWRKGYHGSQAGQTWLYDLKEKAFHELLNEPSGNLWPLWKPDGSGFYYVGGAGRAHELWEKDFTSSAGRQLTTQPEDNSVVYPCISRDGSTIVFRRQFDLYRLQPGKGPAQLIEIYADVDRSAEKIERRSLTSANDVAFSHDGLEIAMIAGGDLWVMDTELREPKQISATPEEERSPVFSPDGNSILFISDRDGKCEIYRATRGDATKYWWQNDHFKIDRLTGDGEQKSTLTWSPDGSHVAFIKGRGELCTMTPDGKTLKTILKSFSHPEYDWAPDGKWLVYSAEDEDFNRDVFIVPIDGSRRPFNVSRHPRNDSNPVWSPDGKLIAFTGQRGEERDIFYVWLRAEDAETSGHDRTVEKALEKMNKGRRPAAGPRSPMTEGSSDGSSNRADASKAGTSQPPTKRFSVAIDWDGLNDRVHRVSIPNVNEMNLIWSSDSRKLIFTGAVDSRLAMYYVEIPDDVRPKLFATQLMTRTRLLAKSGQLVGLSNGIPFSLALDPTGKPRVAAESASGGALAPSSTPGPRRAGGAATAAAPSASSEGGYRFTALQEVDLSKHHAAVFDLAWRTMRDQYYDEHLGNCDWSKIRSAYIGMAAESPDAEALGTVINLMLGELNGSHLGWYGGIRNLAQRRNGPQVEDPSAGRWREMTAHFGARFDPEYRGPGLKVRDVVPGTPADHHKSRLNPGDLITQIDGKAVDLSMDLTTVLNGPAARDVTLTVKGKDGSERRIVMRPTNVTEVRRLLYDKWIKDNKAAVDKLSGGKLGYLHIAAMDSTSFLKFEEQLYAAGAGKDGLLIDVRENGGGSTADQLLTALTQPVHAVTIPRGGTPGYPQDRKVYATWSKPIVVLCNQNSFSNAEIFSHAIKTLKRGQLVGVPTAGGVISTGATTIMDAGLLRLPGRGWFLIGDGQDMELNGAVPQHVLWPQPGEMPAGKDRQLDKAVQVLLEDVKKWKATPKPKLIKASERQ